MNELCSLMLGYVMQYNAVVWYVMLYHEHDIMPCDVLAWHVVLCEPMCRPVERGRGGKNFPNP